MSLNLDTNTSSNHVNNSLTNNVRAPQTPTVPSNPSDGAVTVHHQNGPAVLPIEEPLPSG